MRIGLWRSMGLRKLMAMRFRMRIGTGTVGLNLRHEQLIEFHISKNKNPTQVSRVGALLKIIANIYDGTLSCC